MSTRKTLPYVVLVILLGGTCAAIMRTGALQLIDEDPIRSVLPSTMGEWQGESVWSCLNASCRGQFMVGEVKEEGVCPDCGEALGGLSFAEAQFLPQDTRISRSRFTHPNGRVVHASAVLSGKGRISIHRPQVCLTGGGNDIVETQTISIDVEHGPPVAVTVLDLTAMATDREGKRIPVHSYYAYWFAGRNHETPRHLTRMFWMAADKVLHGAVYPWAYISITGRRVPGNQDHVDEIRSFLHGFVPRIRVGPHGRTSAEPRD